MKRFCEEEFTVIQQLVGKKFIDIFKQLDFYVLHFSDDVSKYSLHTYAPPRVSKGSTVILTATDEYYDQNYALLSSEAYEKDELHRDSLLAVTREKAKKTLKNSKIIKVNITPLADIELIFDNGSCIDIFINCSELNCEHYRFFKQGDSSFPHYVVRQKKSNLFLEIVP